MPKIIERQELLNDVEEAMRLAAMDSLFRDDDYDSELDSEQEFWSDEEEEDSPFETLLLLHYLICQNRYLNPRTNVGQSRDFVENYFLNQTDVAFQRITRVSRERFHHIVALIEHDPVFHNGSTCQQALVHWQLACALDRLGNNGQWVSHARSKLIWGIGQGTVHLYTRQVVKALYRLKDQYVQWPTPCERQQISRRMEGKGFKHCIGFVDGTCIPLHAKPAIYGNVFMDRKKHYSVNAQVVCDDCRRIVFFMTGHPGSVGDNRVFSNSILVQELERAFSANQYLLADSAYGVSKHIVPAYKENQRDDLTDRHEARKIQKFNTYLAKVRVVNKHCIGVLKARWTSLKGMRVDIHEQAHMKTFVRQAVACVVLHNICLEHDPWDSEYLDESEDEVEDEAPPPRQPRILSTGQRKRFQVWTKCLAFHARQ